MLKDPVTQLEQRAQEEWILGWEPELPVAQPLAIGARAVCNWLCHALEQYVQANETHPYPSTKETAAPLLHSPRLLIITAEPLACLLWFSAGVSAGYETFLGNPRWSPSELSGVIAQIEPLLIVGAETLPPQAAIGSRIPQKFLNIPQVFHSFPQVFHSFPQVWGNSKFCLKANLGKLFSPYKRHKSAKIVEKVGIFIPTGGSSGALRFAHHGWSTLLASVQGLRASNLVPIDVIHSFCLLPLYHVSGLMQFVRSLSSGGKLAIAPFPSRKGNFRPVTTAESYQGTHAQPLPLSFFVKNLSHFQPDSFFLSLVPTQLQRLLEDPIHHPWLQQFHMILLGGAPAWPSLLDQAQALQLPLAPTYGMTETASQVVTLSPQDFLAGVRGCGQVLPHAQVEICGSYGEQLPAGQVGAVRVRSRSLAQGYWALSLDHSVETSTQHVPTATYQPFPQDEQGPYLLTDDLGHFDEAGYLHIVGRSSNKIISGGENIFPAEVEAAIRATGLVADVAVCGQPDEDWGERVVAVVMPLGKTSEQSKGWDLQAIQGKIVQSLSPAKRPKDWIVVHELPRNAQGKLNQQALRAIVQSFQIL